MRCKGKAVPDDLSLPDQRLQLGQKRGIAAVQAVPQGPGRHGPDVTERPHIPGRPAGLDDLAQHLVPIVVNDAGRQIGETNVKMRFEDQNDFLYHIVLP